MSQVQRLMTQTTCLRNLQKVLELGGSSLEKVVKYNVYLDNMDDFAEMNEAYIAVSISTRQGSIDEKNIVLTKQFIPPNPPSRSCLEAKPPGGMRIEIECIAQA